jgi:hypothetical protein
VECLRSATSSDTMKLYLMAIGTLFALQVMGADESASLREVLRKSITPGELREDWLEQNLKTWPGIKTLDGVAALYDLWTSTNDGFELLACARIQERLQVPSEQVASFLMERANRSRDDTYMMMRYLDELEPYSNDPRVTKYYASLLPDKRPLNRNRHPVEGGHTVRVCDIALKNLTKWLEKKNLLKWGDPGFVWDVLHVNDFENNIVAIRPYLIETGVIEEAKQSQLDGPDNLQPTIVLDANEAWSEKSTAPEAKPELSPNEEPASSTPWGIIVVLIVVATGLLWLLFKGRK